MGEAEKERNHGHAHERIHDEYEISRNLQCLIGSYVDYDSVIRREEPLDTFEMHEVSNVWCLNETTGRERIPGARLLLSRRSFSESTTMLKASLCKVDVRNLEEVSSLEVLLDEAGGLVDLEVAREDMESWASILKATDSSMRARAEKKRDENRAQDKKIEAENEFFGLLEKEFEDVATDIPSDDFIDSPLYEHPDLIGMSQHAEEAEEGLEKEITQIEAQIMFSFVKERFDFLKKTASGENNHESVKYYSALDEATCHEMVKDSQGNYEKSGNLFTLQRISLKSYEIYRLVLFEGSNSDDESGTILGRMLLTKKSRGKYSYSPGSHLNTLQTSQLLLNYEEYLQSELKSREDQ